MTATAIDECAHSALHSNRSSDSSACDGRELTAGQRQQILLDWTKSRRDFPCQESIAAWFTRIAEQHPNSIALSMGNQRLTYAELNAKANSLAHRLIAAGVTLESRVGICIERSLEKVVGILGILKAGGAYVPLDPNYPQDRLEYMINDAEIRVMVCDELIATEFAQLNGQLTTIHVNDCGSNQNVTSPVVEITPDAAAYVIYTSGSTGQPKGCVLTHANVVRLFLCCESLYSFTSEDVWTLFHSISFDFSVWEIWGALLYGGRLVVVPYATSRSPKDFWNLLIEERVTVLNQTPSAFRQLMQAEPDIPLEQIHLRYVIFGGEGLDPRVLRAWFERHGDATPELINMYGITETTVHVTYRKLTARDVETGGSPIGYALPDLSVYLLDQHGQPVPIGTDGEIYVYGPGLARGYLNRPELTAARFVRPQFPECPPGLLYRSGDLARWNEDGSLEFLGRMDKQVKIRGHRVELGEIEAAAGEFSGIATCAVISREMDADDTRLICYFVAANNAQIQHSELDQYLRQRLPIYMVPSAFVQIPFLPLTINGKLDKKALPDPASTRPDLVTQYVAPRNEVEELIANIWKQVLGVDRVGIHDNFFELGGHSLLATRIVEEVSKALPGQFKDVDLFSHLTIAQLTSGKRTESTQQQLDQHRFLEAIRMRGGTTHLVMVGISLRPPLDSLPSNMSAWLLKKDGFHTWPPLGLDLHSEAKAYAKEIRQQIPTGKLILCGHSYSGLLALETANQLADSGCHQIELVLLEPFEAPLSSRIGEWTRADGKSIWQVIKSLSTRTQRRLSSILSSFLARAKFGMKRKHSHFRFEDRFALLLPNMEKNASRYSVPAPNATFHIIGRKKELIATGADIQRLSHRPTTLYELDDQLSHTDIARPEINQVWVSIIQKAGS